MYESRFFLVLTSVCVCVVYTYLIYVYVSAAEYCLRAARCGISKTQPLLFTPGCQIF